MIRPPFGLAALDMAGTTVLDDGVVEYAFHRAVESTVAGSPAGKAAGSTSTATALADPEDFVRRTMGQSKISVFTELFAGDTELATQANAAFEDTFDRAVERGDVEPMPGAVAAIRGLQKAGIRVCLTTGFAPPTRDRILTALGWTELADLVLSPADAGRGRPSPDMILTAVLRLGIDDVAEVAVAGDTVSDLVAGTRAGASVVAGVLTGSHSRAELEDAPHTHILPSVIDLPAVLLG
jgi:phosphonatase-like hydrolase